MTDSQNSADLNLGEHVRRRPGMYVGGLNAMGLRHCIDTIVVEQLRLPGAKISRVRVAILGNLEVSIGLLGVIPQCDSGKGFAEIPSSNSAPVSDFSVVSAVSEHFKIIGVQDGQRDRASFTRGKPASPREVSPTDESPSLSVSIRFDSQLFPQHLTLDYLSLCGRVQE